MSFWSTYFNACALNPIIAHLWVLLERLHGFLRMINVKHTSFIAIVLDDGSWSWSWPTVIARTKLGRRGKSKQFEHNRMNLHNLWPSDQKQARRLNYAETSGPRRNVFLCWWGARRNLSTHLVLLWLFSLLFFGSRGTQNALVRIVRRMMMRRRRSRVRATLSSTDSALELYGIFLDTSTAAMRELRSGDVIGTAVPGPREFPF